MSEHLQRGILLVSQGKHTLAERELRAACADLPQESYAHAFLAYCLLQMDRFAEAQEEAEEAIRCSPDNAFAHVVLARVFIFRDRYREACEVARRAIDLDPGDVDSWSTLALAELSSGNWQAALEAADQGLALDPEDHQCQHVRSTALMKLGRSHEAEQEIHRSLQQDPDNALAHANQGWALLERGDYRQAQHFFREALRLEPDMDWAREGIVTALKARNPLYRWVLNYFLWMAKLSGRARWGVVIGLYVLFRVLGAVSDEFPALRPITTPLIGLYVIFVLMTWLADPLMNLLLRLHPTGKYALSTDQRRGATLMGLCVLAALGGFGMSVWTWSLTGALLGIALLLVMIPCSAIYRCDAGWPRWAMAGFSAALAAALPISVLAAGFGSTLWAKRALTFFIIGIFVSFWVGNVLTSVRVRH